MTIRIPPAIWIDHFDPFSGAQIVVANQVPAINDVHVSPLARIDLDVLDLGPNPNQPNLVQVWIRGILAYDGVGFQPPWHLGSTLNKIASPGSAVNDIWRFSFYHGGGFPFTSGEVVPVRVEADSTGAYNTAVDYTFTAADTVAPLVDSVEATGPRYVVVTFNEGVDPDTVIPANFTLSSTDPPYYLAAIESVEELFPYQYRLKFDQELSNGREYDLAIENVQDLAVPPNTIAPVVVPFTSAVYPAPDDRRWDLWSMVPARVRWADRKLTGGSPGHTQRFIQVLQEVVDLWLLDVDTDQYIMDIDRAPEGAIDLLLRFFRNPFPFVLTDNQKRKLARMLFTINASKHAQGIIDVVFFFMGIVITITPLGYGGGGWRLATAGLPAWRLPTYGKLGVTTRLLGTGPGEAWPYTFIVDVPVALSDDQRQQLVKIIEVMKAAHEHYIIHEPTPPPPATWLLGVSGYTELGITTRLGT